MKKNIFSLLLFFLFLPALPLFAAGKTVPLTDEELDYAEIVGTIQNVRSPYLKGDYVIFTAEPGSRYIGIAFDFENFGVIHSFQVKKLYNIDYNESGSIYFYILKLPKSVMSIDYRLIIDGLWTVDPLNVDTVYSIETGVVLSHFDAYREIPRVTETVDSGNVRFVYRGKPGQKVRVGGSFTNWDSWIYQMTEIEPGMYVFELLLPHGKYEYAFYTGISSFPDSGNPRKCYAPDGKTVSLLIVN